MPPANTPGHPIDAARAAFREHNLPEAERLCRVLLQTNPDSVDALNLLGVLTAQTQRTAEAAELLGRAATLAPERSDVYGNLGSTLQDLDRGVEALNCFDHVIALDPTNAQAHYLRGTVLHGLRRHLDALASYDRAAQLTPDDPDCHYARSRVLGEMERYQDALQSSDRVLALESNHMPALINRGNALGRLLRYEEALENFDRALSLAPDSADLHSNMGVVFYAMQKREAAFQCFSRALELDPAHQYAASNIAGFYLQQADFARGWRYYESRWVEQRQTQRPREFHAPPWLGLEALEGKTILLYSEQGFGDTIQFCRYAKQVARLGAQVILEVQPPLLPLLHTLEGAAQVLKMGDTLPALDYHCPLMSLGLAFKTDLNSIPAQIPYIQIDEQRLAIWRQRLGEKSRPRIGIVWSGNPAHKNDHNRSIALTQWLALFSNSNVEWHSLSRDLREGDQALLAAHPEIQHWGQALTDFADTAALTSLMDLIITVDTSIAHLAGAMGKPVWILLPLNPDWRWLLEREDSPWYPTARLFRQRVAGDWKSVMVTVQSALDKEYPATEHTVMPVRLKTRAALLPSLRLFSKALIFIVILSVIALLAKLLR